MFFEKNAEPWGLRPAEGHNNDSFLFKIDIYCGGGKFLVDFIVKNRYNINDLLEIMSLLRSEQGCPWDREQNHLSIAKNFIEETYEVIDAIHQGDLDLLKEELGDVLMQVVFHAQMEKEADGFTFEDVVDGVCKKLVHRHPHVFGDVIARDADTVLKNWDDIKKVEKGQAHQSQSMQAIPRQLPALMRATKVQQKAAKVGFDWDDLSGALDKLEEEIGELKQAVAANNTLETAQEMGDLLFAAVNVSRFVKAEAEEALTAATDKFIRRFTQVEEQVARQGLQMQDLPLAELDRLWDAVKEKERA